MNYKSIGEIGENCVIGELAKFGIGVAPVLSDNYPFEMIAITDKNLFKIQVKTSTTNKNGEHISFSIASNNWLQGTIKKYTKEDCDVVILYDLVEHNCFLLSPEDFENRRSFTIRYKKPITTNKYGYNWFEDFQISHKRILEIFDFDAPDLSVNFAIHEKSYQRICQECGENFTSKYRNAKYCSSVCRNLQRRKVERPSKEELKQLINTTSFLQIGRKYQVSDNAVRKWAKQYELI